MPRSSLLATFASRAVALSLLLLPVRASAQAPPLAESVAIGAWTFRPSVEVRVRGEYRRDPIDQFSAGRPWEAVLEDAPKASSPTNANNRGAVVENQWGVGERTRLGIAVDRGPVTGVLLFQDARVLGSTGTTLGLAGWGGLSALPAEGEGSTGAIATTAPYEAYIDVHTRTGRPVFLRIGRQRVVWGEGRLLGESDWSPTARSLDAVRFGFQVSDFDIEMMASLLLPPGGLAKSAQSGGTSAPQGNKDTGAQLYGINVTWHFMPLLNAEVAGLARIVRMDVPTWVFPSDTYVLDGRLFGDRRGFRYGLEGAYELGRVASYGGMNRDIRAFAAAGRASLETSLPGHLTFGVQGAYASGDNGDAVANRPQTRFDPISPDEFSNHGPMGLYAWSNLIEAGGDVAVAPAEPLRLQVGYRFVALASPKGRWTAASLAPIGASDAGESRVLGSEVDASVTLTPWDAIQFKAGYGLFLFGDKAKVILSEVSRASDMQHWGYLQAVVQAP